MRCLTLITLALLTACQHSHQGAEKLPEVIGDQAPTERVPCDDNGPMEPLDGRPAVLIVGSSISIGYTPYVAAEMPDFQVVHNVCNARSSRFGRERIEGWVHHADRWEICTLGHGLHDIRPSTHVPLDEYVDNLRFEIEVMKERCDRIFYMTMTLVPEHEHTGRRNEDAEIYNAAAVELMDELNVPVCDLNAVSKTIPHLMRDHELQNDVHYTKKGYRVLGEAVADCIR